MRFGVRLERQSQVALVVLCGLLASGVRAQEPPTPPATPPVETAQPTPAAKPDFEPLARALAALNAAGQFTYTGETEITGAGKGITFKGRHRVIFSGTRKPERVRAEVQTQLGDEAGAARRYLVVGDGTKLWTHQPGAKRYGVTLLKSGALAEDFNALGLLGALYFNRDLIGGIGGLTAENSESVLSVLKNTGIELTAGMETWDGAMLPVYTLVITKQNVTLRFFVDPKAPVLTRMELTAKSDGIDLKMSERIVTQNTSPTIAASAFRFAPPSGSQKIPGLEVELF